MADVAPIPIASEQIATRVNTGSLRRTRRACFKGVSMGFPAKRNFKADRQPSANQRLGAKRPAPAARLWETTVACNADCAASLRLAHCKPEACPDQILKPPSPAPCPPGT